MYHSRVLNGGLKRDRTTNAVTEDVSPIHSDASQQGGRIISRVSYSERAINIRCMTMPLLFDNNDVQVFHEFGKDVDKHATSIFNA